MQRTDGLTAEANRLYWETDVSVADIAQQLELSRRALYDAVQPLPSGNACPTCGTPLVFENRSARNSGHEICTACAAAREEAELAEAAAAAPDDAAELAGAFDSTHAVRVGSAALAGAALGALATIVLVPRR